MFETGENPGSGSYYCTECYKEVDLHADDQSLPKCPVCSSTTFEKA
ncbi:MAG: zinc ribbon-containing protein [Spirochaetota bacterium]